MQTNMATSVGLLRGRLSSQVVQLRRSYSANKTMRKGLVLGLYQADGASDVTLTKACQKFDSDKGAAVTNLIKLSGLSRKSGNKRIFYGLDEEFGSISVVKLGKPDAAFDALEEVDERRENVRAAVAAGVSSLKSDGVTTVFVDPCGDPEAAAEAAHLCVYTYNDLKTDPDTRTPIDIQCYTAAADDGESVLSSWRRGVVLAEAQNLAKRLMETPANLMTPTDFARVAEDKLASLPNVQVRVRDQAWAEQMKMYAFLGVSRGSDQPPKFLEVQYSGGNQGDAPLAIVGKGVTFDSGGISIKPSAAMGDMRADMGGAACTLSAIYAAAKLGVPLNVMGFMPLCENMPGGKATKPGDVLTAMNGKTIQVDNTDAEGRLILADALCYAETFKPRGILDIATLTGGIMVALGSAATGVFTNSTSLWDHMHEAGMRTGDRVWRMPLWKHYTKQVTEAHLADVNNVASAERWGSACTAAAFLKEFVSNDHWMHLDIAGTASLMGNKSSLSYMAKSVTGRPTRTLVEFMNRLSKSK